MPNGFYKDALDVLLKRWAAEKRIQRDPIYQDLTLPLEEMMLAEIAYTGFVNNRLFFSGREVVEQIRTFLASNLNAPRHLDGDEILNAIQVQQGILVERARNALSFSHLTLQEYLTAQHIADHNLINQLVANHLCNQRWREVFLLVAGLMRGGADDLLLQMETATQQFINTDTLKNLLRWAEQATEGSEGNFKLAAKRTAAILAALIFSHRLSITVVYRFDRSLNLDSIIYRNRSIAIAQRRFKEANATIHNVDPPSIRKALQEANEARYRDKVLPFNTTLDLAYELEKARIFNSVNFTAFLATLEGLKPAQFKQTWYDAFQLNSEWVNLSEAEANALNNYLYANELIVRCKEAAVRVSPQVGAGIEERMLTVRDEGKSV